MSGIDSLGLPPLLYERPLAPAAPGDDAVHTPQAGPSARTWFSFDEWSGLDAVIRIADGATGAVAETVDDAATEMRNAPHHRKNREGAVSNIMNETHETFTDLSFQLTEQQMRWRTVERAPDVGQMTGDILGRIVAPR